MTIIYVPESQPSISAAIAVANPFDIIQVSSGVYNETININVPDLTLQGFQANVDARSRSYNVATESVITYNSPSFGTGIVNISAANVIFNGFTVQGNIVNSTAGIFSGDPGQFLPSTTTLDVTGLQIIYNIIQNNANGILISSIEPTPKTPNYLFQYNYLQNNSGDPSLGNGQGIFVNNSSGLIMSNILITQNLFNGLETSASVNLSNINTGTVSANVMNQDNSIALFGTNNVTITQNVTSYATGITPSFLTNYADAVYISSGNNNTVITNNLILNATQSGIHILNNNNNLTISNNCIKGNTISGVLLDGPVNSSITINSNNIEQNTTGLQLNASSYTIPPLLDATQNYWNNFSGPNYNGTGLPGSGDSITDNNISSVDSVQFIPFLTSATTCSSPFSLSKTSTSTNVTPGTPVNFTIQIIVPSSSVSFEVTSFNDPLPALTSGLPWSIQTQSPIDFFVINGYAGSQNLALAQTLPSPIPTGTYTVTISANTNIRDQNTFLVNNTSVSYQVGGESGINQTINATAYGSIAFCIPNPIISQCQC